MTRKRHNQPNHATASKSTQLRVASAQSLAQVIGGISMPTLQRVSTDDLGGFNFELNGEDRYIKA